MTTIVQLLPDLKHVLQRGLILSFAIAMMQQHKWWRDHNILMLDTRWKISRGSASVWATWETRLWLRGQGSFIEPSRSDLCQETWKIIWEPVSCWRKFYVGRSRDSSKVKACSTCRHTGLHKIFAGHHNPTSLYLQVPGKVLESVKHWNHLSFAKLPAWMKDNEFIKFYHRFFSFHFYSFWVNQILL